MLLGVQYQQEDTKVSQERIMEVLNLEPSVLKVVLNDLESSLLICQTQTGDCVLAQQPERISLFEVTEAIKGPPERSTKKEEQQKTSLSKHLEELTENESEDVDSSSVVGALGGLVDEPDPLLPYRGVSRFGETVLDTFYENIKTGPGQLTLAELVQQLQQTKPAVQEDSAEPLQMLPSGV